MVYEVYGIEKAGKNVGRRESNIATFETEEEAKQFLEQRDRQGRKLTAGLGYNSIGIREVKEPTPIGTVVSAPTGRSVSVGQLKQKEKLKQEAQLTESSIGVSYRIRGQAPPKLGYEVRATRTPLEPSFKGDKKGVYAPVELINNGSVSLIEPVSNRYSQPFKDEFIFQAETRPVGTMVLEPVSDPIATFTQQQRFREEEQKSKRITGDYGQFEIAGNIFERAQEKAQLTLIKQAREEPNGDFNFQNTKSFLVTYSAGLAINTNPKNLFKSSLTGVAFKVASTVSKPITTLVSIGLSPYIISSFAKSTKERGLALTLADTTTDVIGFGIGSKLTGKGADLYISNVKKNPNFRFDLGIYDEFGEQGIKGVFPKPFSKRILAKDIYSTQTRVTPTFEYYNLRSIPSTKKPIVEKEVFYTVTEIVEPLKRKAGYNSIGYTNIGQIGTRIKSRTIFEIKEGEIFKRYATGEKPYFEMETEKSYLRIEPNKVTRGFLFDEPFYNFKQLTYQNKITFQPRTYFFEIIEGGRIVKKVVRRNIKTGQVETLSISSEPKATFLSRQKTKPNKIKKIIPDENEIKNGNSVLLLKPLKLEQPKTSQKVLSKQRLKLVKPILQDTKQITTQLYLKVNLVQKTRPQSKPSSTKNIKLKTLVIPSLKSKQTSKQLQSLSFAIPSTKQKTNQLSSSIFATPISISKLGQFSGITDRSAVSDISIPKEDSVIDSINLTPPIPFIPSTPNKPPTKTPKTPRKDDPDITETPKLIPFDYIIKEPRKRKSKSFKQKLRKNRTRYTASLGAVLFNIRGKRPKYITGLEVRPLPL